MICVLYKTGARASEFINIKLDDFKNARDIEIVKNVLDIWLKNNMK